MPGPLSDVRMVELAGLGPAPFCGMVMADLGADVIRVDRPGSADSGLTPNPPHDFHNRGKRSIGVDLKTAEGVEVVLRLVETAEILIEGFRPGVTERLGIGPAQCLAQNPTLVYGRVTGWGQTGPMAAMAGHDIDYIALSGVLNSIGPPDAPMPPLNLVGDFGGGGMLLTVGVLAALHHARQTEVGQVVDAAMVDGSALLSASHHGFMAEGWWDSDSRLSNLLDGGAPFYGVYETSDGQHVAVGALEPHFFRELVGKLDLDEADMPDQFDREAWAELREILQAKFQERTRDEWSEHFAGTDACVAPVLSMREAPGHPHNRERGTFVNRDGVTQPAPAPRFSETPTRTPDDPVEPGSDTASVMSSLGYRPEEIVMLKESGAIA